MKNHIHTIDKTPFTVSKSRTGAQTKIFGLSADQAKRAVEKFNLWLIAQNPGQPVGGQMKAQGARICRDGSVRCSLIFQGGKSTKKILKTMGLT